jgi:5-methylcytosine-specific restriction endonuclease McrA
MTRVGSAAERGYDHAWRKVRLVVLARDEHRCAWCHGPATTVDHVRPLAEGGDRLDLSNLVACCVRCNSRRGQQVTTRRRRVSSLAPGSGFVRA